MADPFAIMTPGQSLESGVGPFNREWHNAMTDLHQRTVRNRTSDMTQGEAQLPEDTKIWIANVEGTILPRYSAIGISPILLTYPGEHTDFTRRMCFITTPLVRGRPFAILQKTLHANETYIAKTAIAADEQQPPTTGWVRLIGDADAYDSTAHYAIGEQVTSGGTTYAAIQPVDGESLTNTSYWLPLGPRRGMWDGTAYAAGDVVAIPTLGEILISGHSRCTVTVGHASHNYAGISDLGIVSQADPGPLEIISKDGTGEQSCIVRFCCDVISNPSCTGTGALSLPTLTTAGAGIRYGGDLITGVMTMAGAGTFSPPVCTGEDGPTLAALTISGSGKVYDPNPSGRLYFGPMTLAGSGTVTNPPSGFAWIPFATMTLAGSGTVDPPTCTGTGAMTFGVLNIDGNGLNLTDCCPAADIEVYEETDWTTPCTVTVLVELTATGGMPTDAGSIGEDFVSGGGGGGAYSASVLTLNPGTYSITEDADFVYFSDATPTVLVKAEKGTAGTVRLSSSGTGTAAGGAGGLASNGIGDVKYSGGDGGQGEIFAAFLAGGGGGGAGGRYAAGVDGNPGVDGVTSSGQGGISGGTVEYLWDTVFPGDDLVSTGADGLTTGTTGYVPIYTIGSGITSGNIGAETTAGGESRFQARITVQSSLESASSLLSGIVSPPWTIKARNASTTGVMTDVALADLTAATPVSGDFVLGMLDTGEIRKYDIDNLPSGGGSGDVTAASAFGTDNRVIRSDGTGKGVQASTVTIEDTGDMTVTGTIAASNLSGTNTGDQTITLTGDVTGSGTGSFAATISNDAVTNAKLADMSANSIKMNVTGSAATPDDVTLAGLTAATPSSGDFILGMLDSGEIRKYDFADFGGGAAWTESAKSADWTVTTTSHVLYAVSVSGGNVTATLPTVSGNEGLIVAFKISAEGYLNKLTIDGNASETIDGAATLVLAGAYDCVVLMCGASTWHVLADARGIRWRVKNYAVDFTVDTATNTMYTVGAVIGGYTGAVTLPAASSSVGLVVGVKLTSAFVSTTPLIIDANSTETIDGALTCVLRVAGDSVILACDGSNWHILSDNRSRSVAGWTAAPAGTWTYASADSPTFTLTVDSDVTDVIGVGSKIKLTQTTVKYFIVTAISYSSPNTTITLYGGTDYTLANAAITSPYYSYVKSPVGFPMSPAKWQVKVTDANDKQKTTPTTNTWYGGANAFSTGANITISVPIGVWRLGWSAYQYVLDTSATITTMEATLSSSDSSESDEELTASIGGNGASSTMTVRQTTRAETIVTLAAKTTYYLLLRTETAGMSDLNLAGTNRASIITAECVYL